MIHSNISNLHWHKKYNSDFADYDIEESKEEAVNALMEEAIFDGTMGNDDMPVIEVDGANEVVDAKEDALYSIHEDYESEEVQAKKALAYVKALYAELKKEAEKRA